ncbi:MAG TPA: hypothetical protein VGL13_06055, partial [Polyangiaceae bacterium]
MTSSNPVTQKAYAGLLAASSAIASNRAYRRAPPPDVLGARFRVPQLPDVPSLLQPTLEHPDPRGEHRLARVTAASLLYAHRKNAGGTTGQFLSAAERGALAKLDDKRQREIADRAQGSFTGGDKSCHYCRLLSRGIFHSNKVPSVVPVNQSAQVSSTFDIDTNIAEAVIHGFQILARKADAVAMIDAFHPLRWHEFAPDVFKRSDQVEGDARPPIGKAWQIPNPPTEAQRKRQLEAWRQDRGNPHYLFEDVGLPINEHVSSDIQNILVVREFEEEVSAAKRRLSYKFSLGACLESDFGMGAQYGGLDVDGGFYEGNAVPWSQVDPRALDSLTERDLAHLADLTHPDEDAPKGLRVNEFDEPSMGKPASPERIRAVLHGVIVPRLREGWGEEPWLVTAGASKRLRYTAAEQTPVALWALLTWLAPANLFVFINRAVCQPAHFA